VRLVNSVEARVAGEGGSARLVGFWPAPNTADRTRDISKGFTCGRCRDLIRLWSALS
jgi:hypothetical protein